MSEIERTEETGFTILTTDSNDWVRVEHARATLRDSGKSMIDFYGQHMTVEEAEKFYAALGEAIQLAKELDAKVKE